MHAASINDGFDAEVKSGATAMNQFVTGGSAPFIGFYYATEVDKILDCVFLVL